jgi:hypothetical protein
MSRGRRIRDGLRRAIARSVRTLGWLVALMLGVRLVAVVAGPLVAAGAGAVVLTVAGVRWWVRVEARLFDSPRPSTELASPAVPTAARRHLALAQALAVVAARYLAECEAENRP